MPPTVQIYLWGIAACLPLLLNIGTRRKADAIGLSAMLVATWCFGRLLGMLYTVPESMTLYPVEDALCGAIAFVAWRTHRETWKLTLAGLFVLQCTLHAAFWLAWPTDGALYFYVRANNGIFALELLCAGWGALAYVASSAVGRVPGLARLVHTRRAGP